MVKICGEILVCFAQNGKVITYNSLINALNVGSSWPEADPFMVYLNLKMDENGRIGLQL